MKIGPDYMLIKNNFLGGAAKFTGEVSNVEVFSKAVVSYSNR